MGVTIVVSGTSTSRTQASAVLRQAGYTLDEGDSAHGFTVEPGETFITAHGNYLDPAVSALEPIDWRLRSHWESGSEGTWAKAGGVGISSTANELADLKARLRAAGLDVGD